MLLRQQEKKLKRRTNKVFHIYWKNKKGESRYIESYTDEEVAHKRMLELSGFDKDAELSKRKDWYEVVPGLI